MRSPFKTKNRPSKSNSQTWVAFVNHSHLEWLMTWVPIRAGPSGQEGQPAYEHEMDTADLERYNFIKEQAEELMAKLDAENWTEAVRRVRMVDTWWRADHASL